MPGHLGFVPALRARSLTRPATLSHSILTGLLRDEMKFRGLIVTDAMDMGGVTTLYAPGEAAVRSVEAGSDSSAVCRRFLDAAAWRPAKLP